MESKPIFISTQEAARLLGIGRDTTYELCRNKTNGFPATKIGKRYVVNRDLLEEWAAKMVDAGEAII